MTGLVYLVECRIFDRKIADIAKAREPHRRKSAKKEGNPEIRVSEPVKAKPQPAPRAAVPERSIVEVNTEPEDVSVKVVDTDKPRDASSTFHTADGKPLVALLVGKAPDRRLVDNYATFASTSVVISAGISICYYNSHYILQTSFDVSEKGYANFFNVLRAEASRRTNYVPRTKPNGDLPVKIGGYSFLLKPKGIKDKPVVVVQTSQDAISFQESELRRQKTEVGTGIDMIWKPVDASRKTDIYNALLRTYSLRYLEPTFNGRT